MASTQRSFKQNILDPTALLATCGGDSVLLQKMIDSFRATVPNHLCALREAAHRKDEISLRRIAHQLRGLTSYYSTTVAAQAAALDEMEADQQVDALIDRCETVIQLTRDLCDLLSVLTLEDLKRAARAQSQSS